MVRSRFAAWPFVTFFMINCTALQSQVGVEFLKARHKTPSGNMVLEWPRQVDWVRLAQDHAPWAFAGTLSPEALVQIKKSYCEPCSSSDVPFDAPLDGSARNGFRYYLITAQGFEPLVLTHLAGRVRFDKREGGLWKRDGVFGEVAAIFASGGRPKRGGFALAAPEDALPRQIPGALFAAKRNGELLECTYQADDLHYKLTLPFEGPSEVEATLTFQIGEQAFCWVQWKPDRGCEYACCEGQYSLFSINGDLRLVDTHLYECDL